MIGFRSKLATTADAITSVPSIVLPIENIQQKGSGTCWAACVVQVMTYVTGRTLCESEVCLRAGIPVDRGASISEIAHAVARLSSARAVTMAEPSVAAVADALTKKCPVIAAFDVGERFVLHSVVLRGLVGDASHAHAVVNDPNLADGFSMFVPFKRITASWHSALVVVSDLR